jgi:hypothetical protein
MRDPIRVLGRECPASQWNRLTYRRAHISSLAPYWVACIMIISGVRMRDYHIPEPRNGWECSARTPKGGHVPQGWTGLSQCLELGTRPGGTAEPRHKRGLPVGSWQPSFCATWPA